MVKKLAKFGLKSKKKTYVVAEIGINHGGDIKLAKELIRSASKTGCDAVKFQTYKTENRVSNKKSEIFEILKKCELNFEDFYNLKKFSQKNNIEFFSTPFDINSAKFLNKIGVKLFKIASFDVTNIKFLKEISKLKKPIIFSTGMSNLNEIRKAYKAVSAHTKKITIMHCVSSYPLNPEKSDLLCIKSLMNNFNCLIGYSDHTQGIEIPLYAVAIGAQVIEKHFKIDNKMNCVDKNVSITENEMKKMVNKIRLLENSLGTGKLHLRKNEKDIIQYRRISN